MCGAPATLAQYLRMPGERIMKHAEELYQQASGSTYACHARTLSRGSLHARPVTLHLRTQHSARLISCSGADVSPPATVAACLQGYISYPRTETDQFDQNYDLRVSTNNANNAVFY